MKEVSVQAISEGIAYGSIIKVNNEYIISDMLCLDKKLEKEKFINAINNSINDLKELQNEEVFKGEEFIMAHIMILEDPVLRRQVFFEIEQNAYYAEKAFNIVINEYINKFENATNEYLKERSLDLRDIRNRVLKNLNNIFIKSLDNDKVIIVCEELFPSLLMEYKDKVAGVIALKGGSSSHGAILCKAREIPYVIAPNIDDIENTNAVIDTRKEKILLDVSEEVLNEYKDLKNKIKRDKPIDDFSKYKIKVLANVSSNNEIEKVMKYNLYGVGLYRTEFIFMNLHRPLTVEEQFQIYDEAVQMLNGKAICFRTFDIGDDKQLSYLKSSKKGIENYRNNRKLFIDQITAMIKANKYSNMKIMFPMIEEYDEFRYLRDWVLKIKRDNEDYNYLKIGMMLETKKAFEHLEDFKDIDFMSIGTNDLSSELYNIKRDDVLNYDSFIDDLIEKIKIIAQHCFKYNIELSICGEIAGCSEVVKKLFDANIKQYSVSTSNVKVLELALKECLEDKKRTNDVL